MSFVKVAMDPAETAVVGGTKIPALKIDNSTIIMTAPPAAATNFRNWRLSISAEEG